MIGYTSINHMGYVMLGIAAAAAAGNVDAAARSAAINGVLVQLVAHGLSTGVLFYLADRLEARSGSWTLEGLGGLRSQAPAFAGIFGIALFANLGLPGLAGFVGEFFIFRGAWATLPWLAALATIGLIVTALALLQLYRAIFLGPLGPRSAGVADLSMPERWAALPLLLLSLLIGVYPAPLMMLGNAAATHLVAVFVRIFA
jgi:NADH-quinone oxidoreductase subunit M